MSPLTTVFCLALGAAVPASAQLPFASLRGIVTDSTGEPVSGARVKLVNPDTGLSRTATTADDGVYAIAVLPPSEYHLLAEAEGFGPTTRRVVIEVGTPAQVDLILQVGSVQEEVTVSSEVPLTRRDHHQVGGVVARRMIEAIPLNGRNALELAKLEPGVTTPAQAAQNRTFVPVLGAGLQTIPRVGQTYASVDGANIGAIGATGTILQVSPSLVQEFQMATVNFDLPTGQTTSGAVNLVTRSGANEHHGEAFFFYRDHTLSAYPGLRRSDTREDPFFRRRQLGAAAGGRLRRDRVFFFTSYERGDDDGVAAVIPTAPEFASLGGIFGTQVTSDLFSLRVDGVLAPTQTVFARHTHDGGADFGPVPAEMVLPSGWPRQSKRVDQSLIALTSVWSATAVSDLRVSYLRSTLAADAAGAADCGGCLGLGEPRLIVPDAGFGLGNSRSFRLAAHRYQVSPALVWQKGDHGLRFVFNWERASGIDSQLDAEPVRLTLWSPRQVRALNPAMALPAAFATLDDILALPLQSFEIGVGPGVTPQRDFGLARVLDFYRVSASDVWRIGPRLTLNAGLAWTYEPNALNSDLTKPALLTPILGPRGLRPPRPGRANLSPTLGAVWVASADGRTLLRGGIGRYFDPDASNNSINLTNERRALLPLGTSRLVRTGANIRYRGETLEFPRAPTPFTGRQLLEILESIRSELAHSLAPGNRDFSVRTIDVTKQATNLKDPVYHTPSAVHVNVGVQRELGPGFVVGGDFVWRRFADTFINGIDYNRWNSVGGPVIPACLPGQEGDAAAVCSNGSIFFDTSSGRARYTGLLARVDKRFGRRWQTLVSYALGSFVGSNGTGTGTAEGSGGRVFGFNNDDPSENYGPLPTDRRHVLNVSGLVDLPWRLQVSFTVAAYSGTPLAAFVPNMDFNGDGTRNDLLPGTSINQWGRGLDRADLRRLVDLYNQQWAGRPTPTGPLAPHLTLPADFAFDHSFFTQDIRITRAFPLWRGDARLLVYAEVFNVLNTANLVGYSGNLASGAFGRPTARFTQVFGSGGPRACQLGAGLRF